MDEQKKIDWRLSAHWKGCNKKINKLWYKLQKNYRNERDPKRFSLASIFICTKEVFNKHCKKNWVHKEKHWHKKDGRRVTNYEICFKQFTQLILQKHKLIFFSSSRLSFLSLNSYFFGYFEEFCPAAKWCQVNFFPVQNKQESK